MRSAYLFASSLFALSAALPAFAQTDPSPPPPPPAPATAQVSPPAGTPGSTEIRSQVGDIPAGGASPSGEAGPGEPDAIIVTGSRIARPNLDSTVPVASIAGEELFQTGQISVGDILNELPSLRNTFSSANSTRFLGTAGLSLLDLRGLGTQRTLVLVNGRRHVGSDILNNAVSPDVNTFPTDLISRVDVVTGGNSAIYGSDAIAGVVNFILKEDFEGLQLRGQGGLSTFKDAGSYYVSALGGKNFADGRGNIAINLEYAHQEDYYASQRPNLAFSSAFVVVDTDPAGTPNGSDGFPDRVFFRDTRSATIANGGQVAFASPSGACGRDLAGNPFTCAFLFNPDGTLSPQQGTRVGISPNGNFVGGNGTNLREGRQLGLSPRLDRYAANVIGRFELSEAFVPFIEAKYVRTDSLGSASGPAFYQGSTLGDPGVELASGQFINRERPRLDNPFLTPQARSVIESQLRAANPAAVLTDATQFSLRRNLLDLGVRQEEAQRDTWRIVGGVRGKFNDDWNYELAVNYGEFREDTKVLGNVNVQRLLLGLDSVRNAAGQIVCRSQVDPTAAVGLIDNAGILAQDIAACVPVNPFGQESISDEARNYIIQDTVSEGKITQFVASGFVSGDSSQWFELPGGPIGVAFGAEYRRETAFFQADPIVEAGYTFYNALPLFDPPAFRVVEGFGEVRVPLLADLPFIKELTVSAAARLAAYKGATGKVWAYNAGVDWAPIEDVRFRGNYSRAVRAPNLADLFAQQSQNFAAAPNDPCALRNIGTGSATREANCRAAGVPAGFDFVYTSSLEIVSGGNPDLEAEKSDSYTYGVVVQPRAIPGLSLSVDYFNIKVNDVITAPTAQQIINACYDASDLENQFCNLFERAGPAGGPRGEIQGQILEGSLQQTLLNYASNQVRGLDTELSYNRRLGDARLGARVIWTHLFQRDDFLDPTDPNRADRILGELGDPEDQVNINLDVRFSDFEIGYQFRFIGPMVLNTWENLFSVQGRPPENQDYADIRFYPSVTYHDLRGAVNVGDRNSFYVGVDNIANTQPPLGLTGIGAGSGIYDVRGRFFYAGIRTRF